MGYTKTPKLTSNAIKAIGERVVANELTYRGWLVVNANSGEENAPNIDIIALKEKKRITIQVKSTTAMSHKGQFFLGYHKPEEPYFNNKSGPQADYIVATYLYTPIRYSCLVTPVKIAENMCKKHGNYWANKPKRNGEKRSLNFPVYLGLNMSEEYGLNIEKYIDAWDLLDK